LSGEAVHAYVRDWIVGIEEISPLAREILDAVRAGNLSRAKALAPIERRYEIDGLPAERIGLPALAVNKKGGS